MRKEEQEHMTKAQCKMRLYEHQKAQREDLDREEEDNIIGTILCALTIIGASTFVGAGIIGIYTYVLGV